VAVAHVFGGALDETDPDPGADPAPDPAPEEDDEDDERDEAGTTDVSS